MTRQIQDIFSKGFSNEGVAKAQQLVESKTSEVRKFVQSSSQDAWSRAMKEATPYLDKLPEIKQLLSDNADKLVSLGAGGGMQELFTRIKKAADGDAAKNKDTMRELREFVQGRVREAEAHGGQQLERGWESLREWVRAMPGGEDAVRRMPDMKVFVRVSQERGEDAKKLAQETYEEVMRVLQEKAKKAKQLSEEAKKDAKRSSS